MLPRLLLFAVAGVHGLLPPSGCSDSQWTTPCIAGTGMSCQSLAQMNLYCHNIETPSCIAACASPCCVHSTTTTTSLTSVTATHTVATHTISTTSRSSTSASSITMTSSATTITATFSTTISRTVSFTSDTNTTTQTRTTGTTSFTRTINTITLTTPEPAILIKVPVEIVVNDPEQYVQDPAVQQAYKAAFVEITGLNGSMVAVNMVHSGDTTTATFEITIPAEETGSVDDIQERIKAVTPDTFAKKVRAKVDAAVGADKYTEKVVGEDPTTKGGAAGDLDAARFGCSPLLVFLAVVLLLCVLCE